MRAQQSVTMTPMGRRRRSLHGGSVLFLAVQLALLVPSPIWALVNYRLSETPSARSPGVDSFVATPDSSRLLYVADGELYMRTVGGAGGGKPGRP